ncbi:hypothetical protein SDC9_77353 [bioreactor metagenome]|jgi:polyisoprenoid-binding protein YceI|uniref:Lipid/polyisoprenoid-binding YceI-like domain-containing protein n=1 Tax=bioreactor metagenome TaxID=1076179 RepID=A0A644YWG3_9ZZZZ|nr:YceI family protein [Petrimonas sp.]NLU30332.1 YceI family protein [Bacteroidales bacterium]BBD45178.1 YceI family protein (Precursor) [Petrimonas sp. IBARAKI]HBG80688.1 hypothetical protein [Porphyromonadaceae bacterium]MDD4014765.1 YceI family protein [Petrimonas sp.]
MKSNFLFKFPTVLIAFIFVLTGTTVKAQTLKIKSSTITISGTTNVHPYTTTSTQASGELTVSNNKATVLNVNVPVKSIINGEKLMDKKTHETFNEPKNPFINFKMSEVKSITTNGSDISVVIGGTLAMAGTSKTVTLEANGKEIKPGTYTFEGSLPLKMSDYNMKAPTAMLGVMKVGDQVTVKYNVTFEGPAVQFN